MPKVKIAEKEISSANILKVQVGTNCPHGGDYGHGGRTILRLQDLAGTAMAAKINDGKLVDATSIEIILGGDTECYTFIEALEFALGTLRAQAEANGIFREEEINF
jgi:hypothetical protein